MVLFHNLVPQYPLLYCREHQHCPSMYYYAIAKGKEKKEENGGRPLPGYSYTLEGKKICDMQINEWILAIIEGEYFVYGYYKLFLLNEFSSYFF